MKKKAIAVLTALTLTLGLAACAGSGTAPAAEPEEAAEETAEEAAEETGEAAAEVETEAAEEAGTAGTAEEAGGPNSLYQIDSDDMKLVAMDNAMVRYAREYYGPEEDNILIPVPCVVYEADLSGDTDKYGEWGTFPLYTFVYDPETLMMKMTGASFSTGVIILGSQGAMTRSLGSGEEMLPTWFSAVGVP